MSEHEHEQKGRPPLAGGRIERVQVGLQERHLDLLRARYGWSDAGRLSQALRDALDDLADRVEAEDRPEPLTDAERSPSLPGRPA